MHDKVCIRGTISIFGTEGLSALIHRAVVKGDIPGIKIFRRGPAVSHLLFADDCFIFCRAKVNEVQHLISILREYEEASGQQVNLAKSEVFFGNNMSQVAKQDLANILGVKHALGTGTYLGLPSMVGRGKKATFGYIKDTGEDKFLEVKVIV